MHIRTKRKGTEFQSDLHHFTDKWTEVPDGEVRAFYLDNDNLEVRDEKPVAHKAPRKKPVVAKTAKLDITDTEASYRNDTWAAMEVDAKKDDDKT